jgi:hypothetical protein
VALREIRKYQKSTELLIRKLPFSRLVGCRMVHGAWCMVHGAWCMVHGEPDGLVPIACAGPRDQQYDDSSR